MASEEPDISTIDYGSLSTGETISKRTYLIDLESVTKYRNAVQDNIPSENREESIAGDNFAPPMSIAALSLKGVVNDLKIPGGTLHTGQEINFLSKVPIGETLVCTATLNSNTVRVEWRFMVVKLVVCDSKGTTVMTGKSTIMIPA